MTSTTLKKRIFITGGTGYIGGSILHLMVSRDYTDRFEIAALVRRADDVSRLQNMGIIPVYGSLDDSDLLTEEAQKADIIFNTANCDHQASAAAIVEGLTRRFHEMGKRSVLIHTSGAGVLTDTSSGAGVSPSQDFEVRLWDDADWNTHADIPPYAPHRLVDLEIFKAAHQGVAKTYLMVPPTVFGRGVGPLAERRMSIQIPRLVYQTLLSRRATYVGTGENVWPNVHVADLAELYLLILESALTDSATESNTTLFYPVAEHFTWSVVSQRIGRVLHESGFLPAAEASTGLQQGWFWGSNVQVKSTNAMKLGWGPCHGGTEAMLESIGYDLELVLEAIRSHSPA
ncbi:NAD-dependent epimerase/dehydratase family protein [Escherichia coli]|nr:NAD-dependent epimerase/dehydratase family protein [Escherichia coli]